MGLLNFCRIYYLKFLSFTYVSFLRTADGRDVVIEGVLGGDLVGPSVDYTFLTDPFRAGKVQAMNLIQTLRKI